MSLNISKIHLKICRNGITRTVLLVGRFAIKIPAVRNGYRLFIHGLLANLYERLWWRDTNHDPRLCPVVCGCPLGLFVVMRRTTDINDDELPKKVDFEGLPADYKSDNFGWLNGRIVLRDYG